MFGKIGAMLGIASRAKHEAEANILAGGNEYHCHVTREEAMKKRKARKAQKAAKAARRRNRGRK